MKLALFSGTFDPIHDGHLALALSAAKQLDLDKVVLLVEPKPRRKDKVAGYEHRLAMAKLATKSQDQISVHEAPAGDQHSVEHTLEAMRNLHPGADIVIILGGDVFEHLPTWAGQDELKKLNYAVGLRSEDDGELALNLAAEHGYQVKLVSTDLPKVSSSQIRESLVGGAQPGHLHPDVFNYITRHHLYDRP